MSGWMWKKKGRRESDPHVAGLGSQWLKVHSFCRKEGWAGMEGMMGSGSNMLSQGPVEDNEAAASMRLSLGWSQSQGQRLLARALESARAGFRFDPHVLALGPGISPFPSPN